MTTNLLDISEKIDPEGFGADKSLVEILETLTETTNRLGIPFFVVGATARDMILKFYDETPTRATRDVDIGIRVPNWEQFNNLRNALLDMGKFKATKIQHSLLSDLGIPVDIVPFGDLVDERKQLRWPNEEDRIMSVLGFDEAYESALVMRVRSAPALDVRIASLPGIVIMKLSSWSERYPDRKRDAIDIHIVMSKYIDTGGLERLAIDAKDLVQSDDEIDIELAGIRLLGRDIARISSTETLVALREILKRETDTAHPLRLVEDMTQTNFLQEEYFERLLSLLEALQTGLLEDSR